MSPLQLVGCSRHLAEEAEQGRCGAGDGQFDPYRGVCTSRQVYTVWTVPPLPAVQEPPAESAAPRRGCHTVPQPSDSRDWTSEVWTGGQQLLRSIGAIAGWWLRSEVIWYKPSVHPESVRDRPTKVPETLFLLSRQQDYFYNMEAVRGPNGCRLCTVWDIPTEPRPGPQRIR